MSITLNGLGPTVTPDDAGDYTIPFANLSFSNLNNATTYTLTITLSDQADDYALINPANSDFETGSLSITDTGANLTSDLQAIEFELQGPWGEGQTPVTLTFDLTSPSSVSLGTEQVFCFGAGTRILTPRGEVPVESLRQGDRVVTARDGGRLAPVKWIGKRRLSPARHPRPWDVNPIRVRADAIGPGRPSRDLLLSPDHALFIDGALIRARDLLNGATVVQEDFSDVTYYHVELDRHDVLLAEGVPAESFLDTGNRGAFENGGVPVMAHPTFARRVWERDACAPLVWQGPKVAAARAMLAARAEQIGWTLTDQPDLHITVRGRPIYPVVRDGTLTFDLPPCTDQLCLRSRSAVPAYVVADNVDTRALGVGITSLTLDGAPLALDGAALSAGWLAAEPGLRWTDGAAMLHVNGARRLEVRTAGLTLPYWIAPNDGSLGVLAA